MKETDRTDDQDTGATPGGPDTHPTAEASASTGLGAPPGTVKTGGRTETGSTGEQASPPIVAADQDRYWKRTFKSRPYATEDLAYEEYRPAYRLGWEARARDRDARFEDLEPRLRGEWERASSGSSLDWDAARPAVREAWEQADNIGDTGPGNPLA